jgi:hypothetical protein
MHDRRRVAAAIVVGVLVVGALVVGGQRLWADLHRSALRDAVDLVPAGTERLSFTDWAQIRARAGVPETLSPTAAQVARLTNRSYDSDLSAVSSINESTAALQKYFGFSPTSMVWEAYAQSTAGATMVARMPDGFDFDAVRNHLRDIGFKEPKAADGVWLGGTDLVASLDPTLNPEVQYVAVLADQHLIVTSDTQGYDGTAAAVAEGHGDALGGVDTAADLADRTGSPAAVMLWTRDFACTDLSMAQAAQSDQDDASAAITSAGKTTPLDGLAMALDADRTFRVLLHFESADQANENLRARAELAVGDAIGRGGSFSDDLKLVGSRTDGPAVVLTFQPRTSSGFVLSALDSGPVVFATC